MVQQASGLCSQVTQYSYLWHLVCVYVYRYRCVSVEVGVGGGLNACTGLMLMLRSSPVTFPPYSVMQGLLNPELANVAKSHLLWESPVFTSKPPTHLAFTWVWGDSNSSPKAWVALILN